MICAHGANDVIGLFEIPQERGEDCVSTENRPLDVVEGESEDSLPIVKDAAFNYSCHFHSRMYSRGRIMSCTRTI